MGGGHHEHTLMTKMMDFSFKRFKKRYELQAVQNRALEVATEIDNDRVKELLEDAKLDDFRTFFPSKTCKVLPPQVWSDFAGWFRYYNGLYGDEGVGASHYCLAFSAMALAKLGCTGSGVIFDKSGNHPFAILLCKIEDAADGKDDMFIAVLEPESKRLRMLNKQITKRISNTDVAYMQFL